MKHDGLNTLFVDYHHLFQFNEVLATAIVDDYYRYDQGHLACLFSVVCMLLFNCRFDPYLRKALAAFVQNHIPEYVFINSSNRQMREFWVAFYNLHTTNK